MIKTKTNQTKRGEISKFEVDFICQISEQIEKLAKSTIRKSLLGKVYIN